MPYANSLALGFDKFGWSADNMLQVELKVLEGRQQGKLIPLNVRQFLIGREQDCHLRPNSDLVSRHHCVFTVDDFTVRLRDLGSTNGTFVNGERIQGQVMLKPGDNVLVGKLSFEIVVREAAAVAVGAGKPGSGPDTSASDDIPVPALPTPESMETALNVSDTIEFPATTPGDDTTIIPSGAPLDPAAAQQQQAFLQPNPYAPNPYAMPPGYGMPPGYPPGYPQGYGYPNYAMPGYMPQPGYGMPQMMPGMQPGYGMAPPAAPPAAPSNNVSDVLDVVLPDPESTGAKAPEPVAPPPPAVDGQAAAPQQKKPSDAAADIIRNQRLRRP